LDAFEKKITSVRSLTSAERKEMKRQRRLIKNRESAQQSRRRKKDRVDELETIVEDLNGINKTLNTKLSDLEAESTILKAEVSQLVGVIRDSPALSDLLRNVTSMLIFYALQASKAQKLALSPVLPLHSHNSIEAC
jgi:predicted  nucleic acid-binding Zn-ribbon protein